MRINFEERERKERKENNYFVTFFSDYLYIYINYKFIHLFLVIEKFNCIGSQKERKYMCVRVRVCKERRKRERERESSIGVRWCRHRIRQPFIKLRGNFDQ